MHFVRVGRYTINLDAGGRRTGLESSFTLRGADAELLRRHLEALGVRDVRDALPATEEPRIGRGPKGERPPVIEPTGGRG